MTAATNVIAHRCRIVYLQLKTDNDMSASKDGPRAGVYIADPGAMESAACSPLSERETMFSGSAEPECRVEVRGADEVAVHFATMPAPADDAPLLGQTKIAPRATIHPTAKAGCQAGSTAVN